jgi:hypothetical protein
MRCIREPVAGGRQSWRLGVAAPPGRLGIYLPSIIRWTFAVAGHYIQPTLEQWELGSMRDVNVVSEVSYRQGVPFAFITYYQRRNLPFAAGSGGAKVDC